MLEGFPPQFFGHPLLRFQNGGHPPRDPQTEPFTKFPGIKTGECTKRPCGTKLSQTRR